MGRQVEKVMFPTEDEKGRKIEDFLTVTYSTVDPVVLIDDSNGVLRYSFSTERMDEAKGMIKAINVGIDLMK